MSKPHRTFQLGKATISIFDIGDIYLPLAPYMNVPENDLTERTDLHGLKDQEVIPLQFTLIQLPETTVLVDAGIHDVENNPKYAIPDYVPPPSLVEQLAQNGVRLEDIEHVIITHLHWDHFNGTTVKENGVYVPQFPNARYYLGQIDWERAQEDLDDSEEVESYTIKVLHDHAVLEIVAEERDIGHGVSIIPAPGETRGHQIVRVHSVGETLYCLGDLYHHPVEFDHQEWMVSWAGPETTLASRAMLTKRAIEDNALLVAGHIPRVGRFKRVEGKIAWVGVQ